MKHLFTFLLIIACTVGAFAQASNEVVFSFDHKAGITPVVLNETVFPIWNNKKVVLTRAEFYIAEVELHHPDGTMMPLTDQYMLVDATHPDAEHHLGQWQVDTVHGVTLHLGIDPGHNHLDPATYASGNPLALQNPTMHWGWTAGYRFMAIEGKVDNNNDGIPETDFQFHNLGDALYKTVELTGIEKAENGVVHLHLALDYIQLFKNIAMTGNLVQHGSAALNIKMMTNAALENFITMPAVTAVNEVVINSGNVSVSPNPVTTAALVKYDLPATSALTMVMTNALGQTVRTQAGLPATGTLQIEKGDLTKGIYQCAFYENSKLIARKQLVVIE